MISITIRLFDAFFLGNESNYVLRFTVECVVLKSYRTEVHVAEVTRFWKTGNKDDVKPNLCVATQKHDTYLPQIFNAKGGAQAAYMMPRSSRKVNAVAR